MKFSAGWTWPTDLGLHCYFLPTHRARPRLNVGMNPLRICINRSSIHIANEATHDPATYHLCYVGYAGDLVES